MAFLFVDSLTRNNSRFLQISVKILELLLLSAGLISTLVVVKGAVGPVSCEIVFSSLLGFWSSIRCFLSSPLLICIFIHVMVVMIVASSTFYRHGNDKEDDDIASTFDEQLIVSSSPPPAAPPPSPPKDVVEVTPPPPPPPHIRPTEEIRTSDRFPLVEKCKDVLVEKEDKENEVLDTIDATWKVIRGEEKQRAKKKQLRKSETWDQPPRRSFAVRRLDSEEVVPTSPKWKELRKAETFNDAVSLTRRGGLVRRDPSMSRAEFNQRVETFINNFNEDIRLQRQESNQRFLEMMNRGI